MAVLRGSGDRDGQTLPLSEAGSDLGRARTQDLVVEHGSVSQKHARIWCEQQWFITDVGSTNHTLLNGAQIEANAAFQLRDGDRVTFGAVSFYFDEAEPGGAMADARAAIEAAEQALNQSQSDVRALREIARTTEEALRLCEAAQAEQDQRLQAMGDGLLSADDVAARERAIRDEMQRQVDAALRRALDMERRYVAANAKIETLERMLREREGGA